MALLDIFQMKKLGGSVILKDNSFLYISKITGTAFDKDTKDIAYGSELRRGDMTISYEDGNGKKKEFKISQVKEVHPMEQQSVFALMNNITKMKECSGYFITKDNHRIDVSQVVSFSDCKVNYIGIYDEYERKVDLLHIKEAHISSSTDPLALTRQFAYIPPETIDKNLGQDYEILNCTSHFEKTQGLFKKRKVVEVPLMDDDLEQVLNRTREQNYKLIEDLIDKGIEKFEITSQTVPNDVYEILIMSKGKKKWFAVLQNENEDVFILDMNSLFIVTAIPNINIPPCDNPEKVEKDNLPLCKTLIDRRTFYSHSVFSKEINTMIGLSKALIADGEVMYNFYVKKSLKETMIEKILKDNLKNDFNILSDELRKGNHEILIYRDNILVKLIFNFEENSNIYCETYSSVDANVEFHSKPIIEMVGNDSITVKHLPSHLKCIKQTRYFEDDIPQTPRKGAKAGKEKVVEVPQAPRKKRNCSRSPILRVLSSSKKLDFQEPSQEDEVDIPTDRIVTFIYKGDEKRVLVKEANDKYTEGICQEDKKYKKYLTRYIEKVIKVEDPASDEDTSDEESQSIPTYKNMILNAIKTCYVNGTRGLSRQALQAYIMGNYNIKIGHFQDNIRRSLKRLVETGCIVQTKQKFKLGDEGRKYLKEQQKPKKAEESKNTKKCDNKLIQDAIDNEKILDIIYDGGSIPGVKRPIRPKRVFMTSYTPKKEILEAICLIDDKVKKFSLDKVKVIA